ncbi:hypothetical protein JTE90_008775 [Oedothorax gibbosus]|uniref:Uncharacterized protein n=1 Tax=Oedothorax gibbosus TaxID=931172 RepID=A0AAV6V4N9_9ARAC|nr:hypothetical protein JTE90_008775 [Oedothorax gibbosus]
MDATVTPRDTINTFSKLRKAGKPRTTSRQNFRSTLGLRQHQRGWSGSTPNFDPNACASIQTASNEITALKEQVRNLSEQTERFSRQQNRGQNSRRERTGRRISSSLEGIYKGLQHKPLIRLLYQPSCWVSGPSTRTPFKQHIPNWYTKQHPPSRGVLRANTKRDTTKSTGWLKISKNT